MPIPRVPDADWAELFERMGPNALSRHLNMDVRKIYQRRVNIEKRIGRQLAAPEDKPNRTRVGIVHPEWLVDTVENGIVLVGSDAHYWPGIVTASHKGFVKFCKDMSPRIVIMNGDVFDSSTISRHPPIGWEKRPTLIQELEACQERLGEIEKAAGKARKIWTLGNHDARFETRLATVAHEYVMVHGFHLKDHFPLWEPCWSVCINDSVVVKHRYKGGVHATWNNTVHAGVTIVTSHTHSPKVTPFHDYRGRRWGADTGTLADPYGPQFRDYTEQNPVNWGGAFLVLTFRKGKLLQPQLAMATEDGQIDYCGKLYDV